MNRPLSALALFAAIAVGLTGCQFLPSLTQPTASSAPSAAPTDVEGFYAQTLRWSKCEAGLVCATASAPIDWDAPADGAMELALVKNPASGTKQGSLLLNPGGPGGSGWEFVFYSGETVVGPAVMESFDVIGWDPRGVGQSTPVTCYTDSDDKDRSLYGTYESPYGTEGWIEELTDEETTFAEACAENTGELLGNIDTVSNAKDMDMLRAVLGDDKLNYLGYSYGTYFGTIYAELFPDKVGRFVLDGAVDPLVSDFESLKFQMAGFDSAFRAYMEFCLTRSNCPFTGSVDDALAQVRTLLDGVDARELVNEDERVLDSATLATGIISNLYSKSYWFDMTDMFIDLAGDDPGLVFTNADYYNGRDADGTYPSNAGEVYVAATCADGDFRDDPATTLERIAQIDAAAPILGRHAAYDDFAVLDVACTNWPFPRATFPASFDAEGAGPILVIGTTNDPATPYASSVSLAKQLSSGVLITHEGEGHTVYNQGVVCIDEVVDAYFVSGTVPTSDPMC